ncbi:hypothetical protein Cfor_00011, partial [Coptotermes formosanus]
MAATASATGAMYPAGGGRGRPLSTIQLISADKTGDDGEEEAEDEIQTSFHENPVGRLRLGHNDSGFENGAFELGSPVAADYRKSTASYEETNTKIAEQRERNHERKITETLIVEMTKRQPLQPYDSNCQTSRVLQGPCTVQRNEDPSADVGGSADPGALRRLRGDAVRSSWLLDGNVRRRDDAAWRRRNTDPPGDAYTSSSFLYHRDYQEALSSLLWEPYDCRQPRNSPKHSTFHGGNAADDADVSVCAVVTAVEGHEWDKAARDTSSSSLGALILSNSSSKDESLATPVCCGNSACNGSEKRSGPVDGSSCDSNTIGNVTADPNQQAAAAEFSEDAVGDLHTRWAVTAPPGALPSPDLCELCWPACSQCEARMLVSAEGTEQAQSVSAGAGASSVSVVNCYRAVPVVVSAVPTISCLNVSHVSVEAGASAARGRTFTSTEAQTDDIGVAPSTPPNNNREQRRRERRERRHQRRGNNNPPQLEPHWQTLVGEQPPAAGGGERLPDILNSHLPPPYSTLPIGLPPPGHVVHPHLHPPPPPPPVPPPVPVPVPVTTAAPASPSPHHHHGGMRFPFQITPGGRR